MMPEDHKNRGELHINKVNNEIEDGGGCCEAWEALSSIRDEEAATDVDPDRRTVLKGIATSTILGGATVASTGIGSATDSSAEARSQTLTGQNKSDALEQASNDSRVETLRAETEWFDSLDQDKSVAERLENGEKEALIVRLVFESNSASIVWSDQKSVDVLGIVEKGQDNTEIALNYTFKQETLVVSKVIKSDEDRQITRPVPVNGDTDIVTSQQSTPAGPCGTTRRLNFDCVVETIEANEQTSKSCSTCLAAVQTGANPASLVACTWCAWDIYQNDWEQPCVICVDHGDEP